MGVGGFFMELSHVDKKGDARMVDVSGKDVVHRVAVAVGRIELGTETVRLIRDNLVKKGDVLSVARIAAIMGGKRTSELIPLCHNIPINSIDVAFEMGEDCIDIEARAVCDAKTGIEMEALTAVSVAALTIYDMCKAVDKSMRITGIHLKEKRKHVVG
jgi:cyclic pyranopterin phosphate synthase